MASQDFFADSTDDEQELARQIQGRRPPDLAPDRVAGVERRVLDHFARSRRSARRPALRWAFALAAAALMLVLAGVGAVSASAGSLPGEWLYPVKRLSESAQVAVSDEAGRAALYTLLAERRLDEVEALAERGVVDVGLVQDLAEATELAVSTAVSKEDEGRDELLQRLIRLNERQQTVLEAVAVDAPEQAQAALANAQEVSRREHDRAQAAIGGSDESTPQASATLPGLASTNTPAGLQDEATRTPRPTHTPRPTQPAPTARPENTRGSKHTPPGQQNTPPGQAHTPSGQGPSNAPPGQQKTPPGQQNTPPGQGGGNNGNNGNDGGNNGGGNDNGGGNGNGNGGGGNGDGGGGGKP